ncbi:class I SAM-dependent methyltransferase [Agrobacterium radiobacter]|uniref:class I SAM-dependent methyltransferase n=1 Tax=Agrobacterium radiobacter TaxID=362 RepID=UPI003F849B4A
MSQPYQTGSRLNEMPAVDASHYREALSESFKTRYKVSKDIWTTDPFLPLVAKKLSEFAQEVMTTRPLHFLDIGAGRGRDTMFFLEAGHKVTALDLVEVDDWKTIVRGFPTSVNFVRSSFLDWETDMSFDAILDNGCFHHQHLEDQPAYLAKMRRLLRPGGRAGICVFSPIGADHQQGFYEVMDSGRIGRHFTEQEARLTFETAGFTWLASMRAPLLDGSSDNLAVFVA